MDKKRSGGWDWRFKLGFVVRDIGRVPEDFTKEAADWSKSYLAEYVPIVENHWSSIWYELWKLHIPTRDIKKLLELNSRWSHTVRHNNPRSAISLMDEVDQIFKRY